MIKLFVKKLPHAEDLGLPFYATELSAGMDLLAAVEENLTIYPMEIKLISTGISIELPAGYEAQVRPRSGLALKEGITVLNTPGTIDADYRGEVKVMLINLGQKPVEITRGMRIAQMVINKFEKVEIEEALELTDTARGAGGFGSTGTK